MTKTTAKGPAKDRGRARARVIDPSLPVCTAVGSVHLTVIAVGLWIEWKLNWRNWPHAPRQPRGFEVLRLRRPRHPTNRAPCGGPLTAWTRDPQPAQSAAAVEPASRTRGTSPMLEAYRNRRGCLWLPWRTLKIRTALRASSAR